ncbi:ASKHA domain-containing protein [Thermanaeromonas sp. C210]|uniref:ASKHA domain-containing protein n=1 Tax=Thermanaeromonas sp. C210 TaxID=2731925 RepID=UPI00155D0A9D|nr:ASKHA domain-containing protein [Thermanaeromonas sp. C210]GFN23602.1 ferredoxin [Thermanaeromonas sp. C210]
MQQYTVTFSPDNVRATVPAGTSILEAASRAGIALKSTCGGQGTCKRCIVQVKDGQVTCERDPLPETLRGEGYTLACQTKVWGHVTVEIPPEARLAKHRVLLQDEAPASEAGAAEELLGGRPFQPLCEAVNLQLDPPTLTENASDWHRLRGALRRHRPEEYSTIGLPSLRELAESLRRADWQVKVVLAQLKGASEVIRVAPADSGGVYGLAVDLGTTTVAAALVDLAAGEVLGQAGTYNRQARFGDDIISRVIHATGEEGGLEELREAALASINEVAAELVEKCGIAPEEVVVATLAGNTTMSHLFLGLTPKYIRLQPYIPTTAEYPIVRAWEAGLNIHPAAPVLVFPSVASYVGGDIVSGTLFTRLSESDELVLFVDIGTNGEMVLGNREWLMACACSAGPAFEGGGITCGMRAMQGAIERVEVDPATSEVRVKVIGNTKPVGICGSGLIDALAKLRRAGILDRMGNFVPERAGRRLRRGEDGYEFVLAWKEESGTGKDITLTEGDVKNLIRSKGAVFAGIQSLLKTLELQLEAIDKIIIAGGFGNYLNIPNAIEIGLLPDLPPEKYQFAGNTSLKGAIQVLLCRQAWEEALEIGRKMSYLELSAGNLFMEEFVSALFLPHTNLELFPSLAGEREGGSNHWPGA